MRTISSTPEAASVRLDSASLVSLARPLASHFTRGEVDDDSAPVEFDDLVRRVLGDAAWLSHVWDTDVGTVGAIVIPVIDSEMFRNRDAVVAAAVRGIDLAEALGARCVSFTGMIPAATDYGRAIARAVAASRPSGQHPVLTTGHAAVVAAFAFNLERILAAAGRAYDAERVAFIGLGSIGMGTMDLLFRLGRHPRAVTLVDVEAKRELLEATCRRIRDEYRFDGSIAAVVAAAAEQGGVPQRVYEECSVILGATSSPNIIDIDRLASGTLLVDDSFPLGFDVRKAQRRLTERRDILITTAGTIGCPGLVRDVVCGRSGDPSLDAMLFSALDRAPHPSPSALTGCVLSSLLTARFDLPPTLGPVTAADATAYYRTLAAHGFGGAPLHVLDLSSGGAFPVDPVLYNRFRV